MNQASATIAVLTCLVPFGAFKKTYLEGQELPEADVQAWPPGMLASRLNNGFVVWATRLAPVAADPIDNPDGEPEDGKPGEDDSNNPGGDQRLEVPAFTDKAELNAWVQTNLPSLDLDMRRGLDTLTAQVQAVVTEHNARVQQDLDS